VRRALSASRSSRCFSAARDGSGGIGPSRARGEGARGEAKTVGVRSVRWAEAPAGRFCKPKRSYNLKNTIEDDEKGLSDKLSDEDKDELDSIINEALDWLDENPEADAEDYEEKQKEVEQVANPIMRELYQQAGAGGAGGMPDDDEDYDFGDDEL